MLCQCESLGSVSQNEHPPCTSWRCLSKSEFAIKTGKISTDSVWLDLKIVIQHAFGTSVLWKECIWPILIHFLLGSGSKLLGDQSKSRAEGPLLDSFCGACHVLISPLLSFAMNS